MDSCIYDRMTQCLHNCKDCPQYEPTICDECGCAIDTYEYDGLCKECFLEKKAKDPFYMDMFLETYPDFEELYFEWAEIRWKDTNEIETFENWLDDNEPIKECYFDYLERLLC